MTALIVIGIVLGVIVLGAVAFIIFTKSNEHYLVNPFSLGKLAFIAVAVAVAAIGWWVSEPDGGFLLDRGLNTTVLFITAGAMYLGHTIWMIRKTNIAIGIFAPVFLAIVSASILAIAAFLLLHGRRNIRRESDGQ